MRTHESIKTQQSTIMHHGNQADRRYRQNPINMRRHVETICSCVILLSFIPNTVVSQSLVNTLPGFSGPLPFKLETGYIGIGELEDVQLFYYFIESERNPKADPLMLWQTGGPGCSGFSSLVYEIGPLAFNFANFSGKTTTFVINPDSWTKLANIIFLDSPVGTGFSYARSSQSYNIGDKLTAAMNYKFLRKWLIRHPKFLSNPLYITGDSYSGKIVPVVVQNVLDGNEAGNEPQMNLQGYTLGNPVTDESADANSQVKYAHRLGFITDDLYEATRTSCNGDYENVDENNTQCVINLQFVKECVKNLYLQHVLEPMCSRLSPKTDGLFKWGGRSTDETSMDFLLSPTRSKEPWCRNYNYLLSYIWANDKNVQNALHVREGTIKEWVRCNYSLSYTKDVPTTVDYHRNLTKYNIRALIYSGDHDMSVPYLGTFEWINSLNLTIADEWKPWFVEGQIGGYTIKYSKNHYRLTFATVKGAGHTAPEYKPKECLSMIYRWLAYYPL